MPTQSFRTPWKKTTCAIAALGILFAAACAPLTLPFGASPNAPTVVIAVTGPAASTTEAVPTAPIHSLQPFALDLTPLPTQTALPTLQLPTAPALPAALGIWDGLPTYLAESRPEYFFRLRFDRAAWALTTDLYGNPALAHRDIANCVIVPVAGRGLPLNGTVDHDVRRVGNVNFQISTAYLNGVRQFVNYAGGDGAIFTSFEVSFKDQSDLCLSDAETVLGTLTSILISQATPIATP